MLPLLVQSWLLLTASCCVLLLLVIGVQRGLAILKQLRAGLHARVPSSVTAPGPRLFAVPHRH